MGEQPRARRRQRVDGRRVLAPSRAPVSIASKETSRTSPVPRSSGFSAGPAAPTRSRSPKCSPCAGCRRFRDAFERSHAELRSFIASLTEERLEQLLAYRDSAGNPYERVMWQLMSHVVNHGTHHRAETAMAMAALGKPMRELDYIYFELERAGARR